jgi:hypothetical protein
LLSPATIEAGPVLCPFRAITGLPCPGCGLARSWTYAAHGDLATSVSRHPVGPLLLVLAVAFVSTVAARTIRSAPPIDIARRMQSLPAIAGIGALLIWWATVRLPNGLNW